MRATAIIIMGASGAGKSTLARELASDLDAPFLEGDSYHPAANIEKMTAGIALRDEDRWPWLDRLAAAIRDQGNRPVVVAACSALKRRYRDHLRESIGASVRFVCLRGDRSTLARRLQGREGHYMPLTLLDDQLETLELPASDENALILDASLDVASAVARVCEWLPASADTNQSASHVAV